MFVNSFDPYIIALIIGIILVVISLMGLVVIGFIQIVKAWSHIFW